jgi:hypothetical protein
LGIVSGGNFSGELICFALIISIILEHFVSRRKHSTKYLGTYAMKLIPPESYFFDQAFTEPRMACFHLEDVASHSLPPRIHHIFFKASNRLTGWAYKSPPSSRTDPCYSRLAMHLSILELVCISPRSRYQQSRKPPYPSSLVGKAFSTV